MVAYVRLSFHMLEVSSEAYASEPLHAVLPVLCCASTLVAWSTSGRVLAAAIQHLQVNAVAYTSL